MGSMWHMVQAGARDSGRELDPGSNYYTTALTTMVVLDEGEAIDSPRVKSECGAMAMAAVHYTYDQYRNFGHQPPNELAGIWDDYTALLESFLKNAGTREFMQVITAGLSRKRKISDSRSVN